jgi:Fe-S cluster biogenesis protein NfuA
MNIDNSKTQVTFESTPNPSTYKFLFHKELVKESMEFTTPQDAEISPLASKIFGFPWTAKVHLGKDFVSITKQDWVEWNILAEPLAGLIQEHLEKGEKIVHDAPTKTQLDDAQLDPISKKIKTIIANEIQPVVALDGGEIVFNSYKDNIVYIHMRGACSGCPSSTATLKEGIEVRIKELIPEVKEVVAI